MAKAVICEIHQSIRSNDINYKKYILIDNIEDICRMCKTSLDTIQYITSDCTPLEQIYLKTHNLSAGILQQKIIIKLDLGETEVPYYKYLPYPLLENDK